MNKNPIYHSLLAAIILFSFFLIISIFLTLQNTGEAMNLKMMDLTLTSILRGIYYIAITIGTIKLTLLFKENRLVSESTSKVFFALSLCSLFFSIFTFAKTMVFTELAIGFENLKFFHILSALFLRLPPQLIFFLLFYLIHKSIKVSLEIKAENDLTI